MQGCIFCGGDASEPDHRQRCDGRQGRVEAEADVRGMVHRDDPATSRAAAHAILRRQNELHAKVIQAFVACGPMTDEQLEQLPAFDGYGPSTIRKRRSELYHMGRLVMVGTRTNSRGRDMVLWRLKEDPICRSQV